MDRWIGKVAVVTGASSGIGLLTAQFLVEKGMIVIGLSRRKNLMEVDSLFKITFRFLISYKIPVSLLFYSAKQVL